MIKSDNFTISVASSISAHWVLLIIILPLHIAVHVVFLLRWRLWVLEVLIWAEILHAMAKWSLLIIIIIIFPLYIILHEVYLLRWRLQLLKVLISPFQTVFCVVHLLIWALLILIIFISAEILHAVLYIMVKWWFKVLFWADIVLAILYVIIKWRLWWLKVIIAPLHTSIACTIFAQRLNIFIILIIILLLHVVFPLRWRLSI